MFLDDISDDWSAVAIGCFRARPGSLAWRGLALPPVATQYSRALREESERTSVQKSTYGAATPDSSKPVTA